jgi:CRP-like cAMP-binding protein
MTNEELKELYFQNPEFGYHLVRLIVGRLKQQIDQLQAASQPA